MGSVGAVAVAMVGAVVEVDARVAVGWHRAGRAMVRAAAVTAVSAAMARSAVAERAVAAAMAARVAAEEEGEPTTVAEVAAVAMAVEVGEARATVARPVAADWQYEQPAHASLTQWADAYTSIHQPRTVGGGDGGGGGEGGGCVRCRWRRWGGGGGWRWWRRRRRGGRGGENRRRRRADAIDAKCGEEIRYAAQAQSMQHKVSRNVGLLGWRLWLVARARAAERARRCRGREGYSDGWGRR